MMSLLKSKLPESCNNISSVISVRIKIYIFVRNKFDTNNRANSILIQMSREMCPEHVAKLTH